MTQELTELPLVARSRASIDRSTFTVGRHAVVALNDGEFKLPRDFLSDPTPYEELVDPVGLVRLPIGCFLIPGDPTILIDAGMGARGPSMLRGGLLLEELSIIGVRPEDIDLVAISHVHPDHRGWVSSPNGLPTFANAQLYLGAPDWEYLGKQALEDFERVVFDDLNDSGRITLLDAEHEIRPGIVAMPAPGHTPGHTVFAIVDGPERAVLLGDSMYCPQQLDELEWGSVYDVDKALAKQTREALRRDLDTHGGLALGCHFPNLHAARLLVQT